MKKHWKTMWDYLKGNTNKEVWKKVDLDYNKGVELWKCIKHLRNYEDVLKRDRRLDDAIDVSSARRTLERFVYMFLEVPASPDKLFIKNRRQEEERSE